MSASGRTRSPTGSTACGWCSAETGSTGRRRARSGLRNSSRKPGSRSSDGWRSEATMRNVLRTALFLLGCTVLFAASDRIGAAGEGGFPASVTFVFGKDSLKLGAKRRVSLLLRQVWNGFTPSGIRLTYAWGNGLPVGSMYRLWEEETGFVVAGPEEVGKPVSTARRLVDDFGAAYGRPPVGGVTEVRVSARRPSREKGPVRASITVRFPAPPEGQRGTFLVQPRVEGRSGLRQER